MIDLTRPRDRRLMGFFLAGSVLFLLISRRGQLPDLPFHRVGQVLRPGLPHGDEAGVGHLPARAARAGRLRGMPHRHGRRLVCQIQAFRHLPGLCHHGFNKYPRPFPRPIKNLRPAQETCEQCHWPQKFVGNLERTYNYFLGDETNTPFTVRMLMNVGGGDPTHGPVGGIHWHMNVGNKIEYLATDEARQKIPWVRVTDSQGVVTEFRTPKFTNAVDEASAAPDGLHGLP